MDIKKIDKNFHTETIEEINFDSYQPFCKPFSVHGVFYDRSTDSFTRLPAGSEISRLNEFIYELQQQTAGGRIRFATDSQTITLSLSQPKAMFPHMPLTGMSGFELFENIGEKELSLGTFIPPIEHNGHYKVSVRLPSRKFRYLTLCMPLYNRVSKLVIELDKGAKLGEGKPYCDMLPVLFYGSSITQGGCASKPGNSYQNFLSRRYGFDFVNLGFSGNAKGECEMADYIASLDMSVFVFDYDHNAPSTDHLRDTHWDFYKTIRKKNASLPIIFASAPNYLTNETFFEERREVIFNNYLQAQREGDKYVYFVDGKDMMIDREWAACFVDGLHPNDLGFYCMAQAFMKVFDNII